MFPMLKQIVSVAIFLFLAFLIGHAIYIRYERPIREGLEGDLDITNLPTDVSGNPVVDESCDITDANKPIELAAAFEKVNKQTDMIRSLTESTEPAVPLKIDKNGNPEYLVITNLKLLMNNGIGKNEASLKAVYDQYIGNREITALTTELNSIKMDAASVSPSASTPSASGQPSAVIASTVSEAFTTYTGFKAFNTSTGFEAFTTSTLFDTSSDSMSPSDSVSPSASPSDSVSPSATPSDSVSPSASPSDSVSPSATPSASTTPSASPSASIPSTTPSASATPSASLSASMPSASIPLDPVAIHAKEIALMCRIKTVIDGHQTLLDRILEKKSDE